MKDIEDFIDQNLGQHVDYDGAFGAQCVDLARKYFDYQGVPQFNPVIGAKEIAAQLSANPAFKKYKAAKKGDVLVWGSNEYNPYGHVAIAIGDAANGYVSVIEQNGLHPEGSAYTRVRAIDDTTNFLGAFRLC